MVERGITASRNQNQRQCRTRSIMRAKCAEQHADMTGVIPHGRYSNAQGAATLMLISEPAEATEPTAPLSIFGDVVNNGKD